MWRLPSLSRRWKGSPAGSPDSERREQRRLIPGLPNRLLPSSQTRFGNSARSQSGLPFHPFCRSLAGAAESFCIHRRASGGRT